MMTIPTVVYLWYARAITIVATVTRHGLRDSSVHRLPCVDDFPIDPMRTGLDEGNAISLYDSNVHEKRGSGALQLAAHGCHTG